MTLSDITGQVGGYFNAKEAAKGQVAQAKAEETKAKANLGIAQASSAWTKYIPLGIGAAVVIGIIAFVFRRKK